MLKVNELVKAWSYAYLRGEEDKARSLFADGKFDDRTSNRVNLCTFPEGISLDNYIVETQIQKCQASQVNEYEVFFRLDINMEFEGRKENCDHCKFCIFVECSGDDLKISRIDEIACYPWELDGISMYAGEFGNLYLSNGVLTPHNVFANMIDNAIEVLSRIFNESYLSNLVIVVFPTSDALCNFLEIKVNFGEMGGKAKGNHLFIVDYINKELVQRTIQHEICHIGLERAVYDCGFLNPILNEALAELAGLSFKDDDIRKSYNAIFNIEDLNIHRLENIYVQTVEERTNLIMLAASLLHFIGTQFGSKAMLSFIKSTEADGSLIRAINEIICQDVDSFHTAWKEFNINGVNGT